MEQHQGNIPPQNEQGEAEIGWEYAEVAVGCLVWEVDQVWVDAVQLLHSEAFGAQVLWEGVSEDQKPCEFVTQGASEGAW